MNTNGVVVPKVQKVRLSYKIEDFSTPISIICSNIQRRYNDNEKKGKAARIIVQIHNNI